MQRGSINPGRSEDYVQVLCDVAVIAQNIIPEFDIATNLFSTTGVFTAPVDFPSGNTLITVSNLNAADPADGLAWFEVDWGDGSFSFSDLESHDYAGDVDKIYSGNVKYMFYSGYTYSINFNVTIAGGTITTLEILAMPVMSYDLTVGRAFQRYNRDGSPDGAPTDESGGVYTPTGTLSLNCVDSYENPESIATSQIDTRGVTQVTTHLEIWDNASGTFTAPANLRSIDVTVISADATNTVDVTTVDGISVLEWEGLSLGWSIDKDSDLDVLGGVFTVVCNGTSIAVINYTTF